MKRIVLIVVLAALAWPLFILAKAHWQIRSIAPELPAFEDIAAALQGAEGPSRVSHYTTASQRSDFGVVGHPGVLIEWPDGRAFLIDTGMPPDKAVDFGRLIELLMNAEPTQTFGSLAQQLGERVQSVQGIAFTHLHSDHTDGLPEICAAQRRAATVYQAPLQYQQRNYTTDMGFEALAAASCERRQLQASQIMPLPGFAGLVAVSLGGHTPGSTLFVTRIDGHYLLFSGDITNDKRSVLEDIPKPTAYSVLVVPEDTRRSGELRRWLRDLDSRSDTTVLPAHDVDLMAAVLPYPHPGDKL